MRTRVVIARSASDEAIRCAPQHSDLGGLLRSARNDLRGASLQMRFLGAKREIFPDEQEEEMP